MVVVPELKTVFITPPRCGSTAVQVMLLKTFSEARRVFRHMELQGCPEDCRDYRAICLYRECKERLLSTYNYMTMDVNDKKGEWWQIAKADTDRSFKEWLLFSTHPFCVDIDRTGFNSMYYVQAITRKPLFLWGLRDGRQAAEYVTVQTLAEALGKPIPRINQAPQGKLFPTDSDVNSFMDFHHSASTFIKVKTTLKF